MLLNGDLGYELVAEFTSYPQLFGIEVPDYRVQESWSSYDHPRVPDLPEGARTTPASTSKPCSRPDRTLRARSRRSRPEGPNLLLTASELKTQQAGGTWTDVFSDGGLAGHYPTLLWLLALQAAALGRDAHRADAVQAPAGPRLPAREAAGPAARRLPHVADRQPQARALRADNRARDARCCSSSIGAALWYRGRVELLAFLRENWRLVLFCEAVFLAAFFFFWFLRIQNPDLWHPYRGGEKPMDLAYFTAVTAAPRCRPTTPGSPAATSTTTTSASSSPRRSPSSR